MEIKSWGTFLYTYALTYLLTLVRVYTFASANMTIEEAGYGKQVE